MMTNMNVPPSELGIDLRDPRQFFKWLQVLAWAKQKEQDASAEAMKHQQVPRNAGPSLTFDNIQAIIAGCPQPPPPRSGDYTRGV